MQGKGKAIAGVGIALFIFIIYRVTSSPTIGWVDSGVIAAAAKMLGIPNPPGFPLYMLIGHLFTKLPIGSIVTRLQILSHVSSLVTLALVFALVRHMVKLSKQATWIALFASLVLAFSYNFWSQAINVETYAATNAVLFAILCAGLWLGPKLVRQAGKMKMRDIGIVLGLSLAGGISLGLNPVISALAAPGIWWLVRYRKIVAGNRWIFVLGAVLAVGAGVAIYSYLPIRASAKPFLNWGDPVNWERIQTHLVGAGLNIYEPETSSINGFTGQPKIWWESFWHYWELALWQFTPFLFPLVIVGAIALFRKHKDIFWPLILVVLVNLTYVVLYYGGNQESWMITSWVVMAVFLGAGLDKIFNFQFSIFKHRRFKDGLVIGVGLVPMIFWFPVLNHSKYIFADEYAANMYKDVADGAVVIGGGDFFHSLTNYTHEVTGVRDDIISVTGNMFYIFPWYRDHLRKHTDLVVSDKVEDIINMKNVNEFTWAIDQLIADNPEKQFYITPLLLRDTVVAGTMEGNYHTEKYKLLPHGLLYKIVSIDSAEVPNEKLWQFTFKYPELMDNKPPFYLERNYKNAYKLLRNDYAYGHSILAEYYLQAGDKAKAEIYFQKAAALGASGNPQFFNRLAIFYAQQGRPDQAKLFFEKALAAAPENPDLKSNYETFMADVASKTPKSQKQELFEGKKLIFFYPPAWVVTEGEFGDVTAVADDSVFTIEFRLKERSGGTPDEFLKTQTQTYGELVNEGPAKFPNVDQAYARLWQTQGVKRFEFFLFQGDAVFQVLVGPMDSAKMADFDQIMSTLDAK